MTTAFAIFIAAFSVLILPPIMGMIYDNGQPSYEDDPDYYQ